MFTDFTDSELMEILKNGDDLAFNEIIRRWQKKIISYLLRMVGNHTIATDLAQEVFVKLYQSHQRYRLSNSFHSYLFTIAANLVRNHLRWKSRHSEVTDNKEINNLSEPSKNPEEILEANEIIQKIQFALNDLPTDLRSTMILFIDHELSYKEIANIHDCTEKTIETRIYRARQLLKKSLNGIRVH
jgi:RNA polymerase sigma-70 factor, ECF subfamily